MHRRNNMHILNCSTDDKTINMVEKVSLPNSKLKTEATNSTPLSQALDSEARKCSDKRLKGQARSNNLSLKKTVNMSTSITSLLYEESEPFDEDFISSVLASPGSRHQKKNPRLSSMEVLNDILHDPATSAVERKRILQALNDRYVQWRNRNQTHPTSSQNAHNQRLDRNSSAETYLINSFGENKTLTPTVNIVGGSDKVINIQNENLERKANLNAGISKTHKADKVGKVETSINTDSLCTMFASKQVATNLGVKPYASLSDNSWVRTSNAGTSTDYKPLLNKSLKKTLPNFDRLGRKTPTEVRIPPTFRKPSTIQISMQRRNQERVSKSTQTNLLILERTTTFTKTPSNENVRMYHSYSELPTQSSPVIYRQYSDKRNSFEYSGSGTVFPFRNNHWNVDDRYEDRNVYKQYLKGDRGLDKTYIDVYGKNNYNISQKEPVNRKSDDTGLWRTIQKRGYKVKCQLIFSLSSLKNKPVFFQCIGNYRVSPAILLVCVTDILIIL